VTFEIARDVTEFLSDPIGRAVVGSSYVVWCSAPDLVGSIHWAFNEHDVRDLVELLGCIHHPAMAATVRVMWDCRDVKRVDSDALLEFLQLLRRELPRLSPRIERQCVVVPDGLAGVLLAGALPSLAPAHPVRPFCELATACAYLAHPATAAAHRTATEMATVARGPELMVARLRSQLAIDLGGATIGNCAAALGLSTRTLQRELSRCATSFSDELRRVRVATAEDLLRFSDMKIEAIASRVGYGTASRLTATLHRERSATATELRAGLRETCANDRAEVAAAR